MHKRQASYHTEPTTSIPCVILGTHCLFVRKDDTEKKTMPQVTGGLFRNFYQC